MITIVSACDVHAVASFVAHVLNVKYTLCSQSSSDHAIFALAPGAELYILPKDDFPNTITACDYVVIEIEDCRSAVERGLSRSGLVLEEYIEEKQEIHIIQGPENIKLVLVSPTLPGSCPILLQWMRHSVSEESKSKTAETTPSFSPPPGVPINTLFPSILHNNTYHSIDPNSSHPIPFSTPHFKGTALLLVKTSPLPPYHKALFLDRNLTFEVQVQGQFTQVPTGTIYIGAEITKTMQLGLITRSLCNTILQYARTKLPLLHYSFGTDTEMPHIVGPLFAMADRIVVTPPGGTAPVLGSVLSEDAHSRKQRKENTFTHTISTENVYTFSTKTNNIDICEWMVVNIPLLRPLDLHTFWSNADLRLCSYIIPDSGNSKQHAQQDLQYIFNLELKHASNHPDLRHEQRNIPMPVSTAADVPPSVESATRKDDSDEEYFDAYEDIPPSPALSDVSDVMQEALRLNAASTLRDEANATRTLSTSPPLIPSPSIDSPPIDVSRPSVYVPYTINVVEKEYFMFLLPTEGIVHTELTEVLRRRSMRNAENPIPHFAMRTHRQWRDEFKIVKFALCSAQRMSKSELRRSELNESYIMAMLQAKTDSALRKKLVAFLTAVNPSILDESEWTRSSDKYSYCASVCRRVDQRCWVREALYITPNEVIFCKGAFTAKGCSLTVQLADIMSVNEVRTNLLYGKNMYYLSINTFAKEYTIVVRCPQVVLQLLTQLQPVSTNFSKDNSVTHDYKHILSKSIDWKLGDRVILNARKYCGRMLCNNEVTSNGGPLKTIECALDMILALVADFQRYGVDNTALHINFMNTVSLLSSYDLATLRLSQTELLCLFVNLYHTLVLHTFYVIGLPATVFKWPQFFNSYAYEAFGDVFSLAELEHCVLKSGLSPPNSLIAQALIPLNNTYSFALNSSDVRILWLLNCGSLSMPPSIPIYKPQLLQDQIEITLKEALDMQISVSQKTIHLPQLCQWYMKDIVALSLGCGSTRRRHQRSEWSQCSSNGAGRSVISFTAFYLNSSSMIETLGAVIEGGSYNVKYSALNYQCRYLEKRF